MSEDKIQEVIPSARRLIKSLRDLGYDFASAVADLIDNSIAAQATLVAIDVEFDGDDSWVRIADNGLGMSVSELKEAMRYGAEREYDANDLGKFGLGLKTASMSQCQRLSVASRVNQRRAEIAAFCWDLDHIEKTNRWEILTLENEHLGPAIRKPLRDTLGTVVLWQRLDRVLGYKHPYGEMARKRILQMCREVEAHVGMVFHRFLSGQVSGKRLKILINGNPVQPWDPFCRKELSTQRLSPVTLKIEQENVKGQIEVEPFVLPHQEQFSSLSAFVRASGPSKWNRQQGFYIYRANRMIQSGGWSGLRTIDEHTKLARVALSFSPNLDEAFKINVAKMRVQLPAQLREEIQEATVPAIKIARETYGQSGKKSQKGAGAKLAKARPEGGPSITSPKAPAKPVQLRLWSLNEIEERLRSLASHNERSVLAGIFRRLRRELVE